MLNCDPPAIQPAGTLRLRRSTLRGSDVLRIFWRNTLSSRIVGLLFLLAIVQGTQARACTQIFSALSINGVQYPVSTTEGYAPTVVSGVIPINLQFNSVTGNVVAMGGVSLRYTIDNQPVGPVLTNAFSWNLDTTTLADGTHALSVLYVNEPSPGNSCYTLLGRQYEFVVSNSGHPISGSQ